MQTARHVAALIVVLWIASAWGCSSSARSPAEPNAPTSAAPATASVEDAPTRCAAEQFVACESGEACTTKGGVLLDPRPCFDHAAAACSALACTWGCDIYSGSPKQILCAANASSTGHMKACAGYSNWQCPENMRCEMPPNPGDDETGRCVPVSTTAGASE